MKDNEKLLHELLEARETLADMQDDTSALKDDAAAIREQRIKVRALERRYYGGEMP